MARESAQAIGAVALQPLRADSVSIEVA